MNTPFSELAEIAQLPAALESPRDLTGYSVVHLERSR